MSLLFSSLTDLRTWLSVHQVPLWRLAFRVCQLCRCEVESCLSEGPSRSLTYTNWVRENHGPVGDGSQPGGSTQQALQEIIPRGYAYETELRESVKDECNNSSRWLTSFPFCVASNNCPLRNFRPRANRPINNHSRAASRSYTDKLTSSPYPTPFSRSIIFYH